MIFLTPFGCALFFCFEIFPCTTLLAHPLPNISNWPQVVVNSTVSLYFTCRHQYSRYKTSTCKTPHYITPLIIITPTGGGGRELFIPLEEPGCILWRLRRRSSAWISKVCGVLAYDRSRRVLTGVQMTDFI